MTPDASRFARPMAGLALAVAALGFTPLAHAVGHRVDVQVVDRDTGEQLSPIYHRGEWWIAGRPGGRYAVTLANHAGGRTLSVISVDGVNALSGETAGWSQSGYVLDAYESMQVAGWRKNLGQIAAFEFTALPDSYAARSGRPANVGVIGVAIFDERPQPVAAPRFDGTVDKSADAPRERSEAVPMPQSSPAQDGASEARRSANEAPASEVARADRIAPKTADKLGTGHGAIERSVVRWTQFDRAQSTPNEIVTIHYDRRENLVAMGIVPPRPPVTAADPFPGSGAFVADPPPRR